MAVDRETLRRHCTAAGKVNTTGGWRDLKVVGFARRLCGPAATPGEWATRSLPRPNARVVLADVEGIDTFRLAWRGWADRLGIGSGPTPTVLGDGAEWIWNAAAAQIPGCRQVVDVYHVLEHLSGATKRLYGDGTDAAQIRYEAARQAMVEGDGR
ncbi:MAG: hypothetical protein JWO38_6902 [Gemmataceae bacterium]|nr:hypothetical protein [Gemmataceae bacterium]